MKKCEACHQEAEKLYNIDPTTKVCLRCRRKAKKKLKKASIGRR